MNDLERNRRLKDFEVTDFSINVSKLIALSLKTPSKLNQIHALIRNVDDIFIKTALINAFGKSGDIPGAQNVFDSISENDRNIITINAMMTIHLRNKQHHEVMALYREYDHLIDDTSHLLVIKASIDSNDRSTESPHFIAAKSIVDTLSSDLSQTHSLSMELRNTMIEFHGHFGDIESALRIFRAIPDSEIDAFAVSNIMKALITNHQHQTALRIYDEFSFLKDNVCDLMALKSCIKLDDLQKGKAIHNAMEQVKCPSIEAMNTLITFYGHFGDVNEAMKVFQRVNTPELRNSVSFGAMMNVLIDQCMNKEALSLYNGMDLKLRNEITDLLALTACIHTNDHPKGLEILGQYEGTNGMDQGHRKRFTVELKCVAIDFYGHFGDIESAQSIFDAIPSTQKDVVMIGCLMKALSHNGYDSEALALYDEYVLLHNDILHLQAINSCIKTSDFQKGMLIHEKVRGNENIKIQTAMIDFYGHFGDLETAQKIFDGIKVLNEVCINSMMTAFIKNGKSEDALKLYHDTGWGSKSKLSDDVSDLLALKACTETNDHQKGVDILNKYQSDLKGMTSVEMKCAAIDFYGHFGDIQSAKRIFNSIGDSQRDVVSVGSMMKALSANGLHQEAKALYDEHEHLHNDVTHSQAIRSCIESDDISAAMDLYQRRGDLVNDTSHILALKACMDTSDRQQFKNLLRGIVEKKERTVELDNVLISCYGHFGDIESAKNQFHRMEENKKNTVTINSLMSVLIDNGISSDAVKLYDEYAQIHDERSHVLALKACTDLEAYDRGKEIHHKIKGKYTENVHLKTALIDLYGNAGDMDTAIDIFESIAPSQLNIVCINSMMESYCKNELNLECIQLFNDMRSLNERLVPDEISYAILLTACTQGMLIETARDVHDELVRGYDDGSCSILDALSVRVHLIAMYGKFGMMQDAEKVFRRRNVKGNRKQREENLYLYNAMIDAYGRNGDIESAKRVYNAIAGELRIVGNLSTFVVLLGACSHCGDSDFAQKVYVEDIAEDSIKYDVYVVTNVIDCYSRTGMLVEARELISKYEEFTGKESTEIMWTALLSGCKKSGARDKARNVYREMCERFEDVRRSDSAPSVLVSNMQ